MTMQNTTKQLSETSDFLPFGKQEFALNKIVYVNSANHGYSEIPINKNLALFGRNNVGKTASMAGCKLLLYPENSFSNCEKKFHFRGDSGAYSAEHSYQFYFPSSASFIALEVENPRGPFCMVLYKTAKFGYSRAFIPLSYNEIRSLFWDTENSDFYVDLETDGIKRLLAFAKENNG